MALEKVNYVDTETVITAENMNAIQDAIIALEETAIPKVGNVTLKAAKWVGSKSPYSQVVAIDGVTAKSQVDLNPSVEQLAIFHEKDLAFVTENDGGTVTVYAIGDKPTNDYTMQVSIMEVAV